MSSLKGKTLSKYKVLSCLIRSVNSAEIVESSIFLMEPAQDHIKRPLNSFMVWAKERRRSMNKSNPRMRNADISKILGEEWRKMSSSDKQPYVQQAVYLRRQHKIEYPHYRYRPRRKHPDQREERSLFERANARLFSSSFPSLSTNTTILGTHAPYSHSPIFHSQGSTPSLDITSGLALSPKFVSPFYPSHLLSSSTAALKDYTFQPHCLSDSSKGVFTDGPSSRLSSFTNQSITAPAGMFAPVSSNLPYLMVQNKGAPYSCWRRGKQLSVFFNRFTLTIHFILKNTHQKLLKFKLFLTMAKEKPTFGFIYQTLVKKDSFNLQIKENEMKSLFLVPVLHFERC